MSASVVHTVRVSVTSTKATSSRKKNTQKKIVCVGYRREQPSKLEGNSESGGTHGGAEGTVVSSRPSVDVDIY
jgi:hypothetical protein